MPSVKYTDDNGFAWVVLVSDDTPEEDYEQGAVLGPPDLTPLGIPQRKLKKLQAELVKHDLYMAPQLAGKRAILKKILTSVDLRSDSLLRELLYLYQKDYYGDQK